MSCLLRYDDTALPVAFEAIRKNIRYCDVKTKQEKRQVALKYKILIKAYQTSYQ